MENRPTDRCRLILACCPEQGADMKLKRAVGGGDVASLVLYPGATGEAQFEAFAKETVPWIQDFDIAVLIADDTRVMGRSGADGVLIQKERLRIGEFVDRLAPKHLTACGNLKDRHAALVAGEAKPDVLFFGKPDGDIKPEPHPKNLALGEWWAEFVEIPCIVMGGNECASALEVAQTGVDFVCLSRAIFDGGEDPGEMVSQVNAMLDRGAPRFEEAAA